MWPFESSLQYRSSSRLLFLDLNCCSWSLLETFYQFGRRSPESTPGTTSAFTSHIFLFQSLLLLQRPMCLPPDVAVPGNCWIYHHCCFLFLVYYLSAWLVGQCLFICLLLEVPQDRSSLSFSTTLCGVSRLGLGRSSILIANILVHNPCNLALLFSLSCSTCILYPVSINVCLCGDKTICLWSVFWVY